ncbi:carboxypeptidase regulatory-like domain-containing protein [bacterium]|nr:carboxypeptidase regulatory-like domain-containing protein [bacterium]
MRRAFPLLSISIIWIGILFAIFLKTETPVGSVEGIVIAGENGKPIPSADITFTRIGRGEIKSWSVKTDENGHFLLRGLPVGWYDIYCSSSAHYLTFGQRQVKISEGRTSHLSLQLERIVNNISLWAEKPVYATNQRVRIWAKGYAPEDKLHITLYRLDLEKLTTDELFQLGKYIYPYRQPGVPPKMEIPTTKTLSWDEKVKRDAEDTFYYEKKLPLLEDGLYKLEVSSGNIKANTFFHITSFSLLLKQDRERMLLWATDLRNGKPIGGVRLFIKGRTGEAMGETNAEGVWEGKVVGPCKIVGKMGSSYAFLNVEDYEVPPPEGARYKIYTYTERPIYRPGQTVFFKCIVRKYENERYSIPKPLKLLVDVKDEDDNLLYTTSLSTNRFGSCHSSFNLPPTAKPGIFHIFISAPEVKAYSIHPFSVSIYRKPEFEVEVKPSKGRYRFGERARIKVQARYLFGVPVAYATVDYDVYCSPITPYREFGEESHGEFVKSGTVETDKEGKAIIVIPLKEEPKLLREYNYSVDITVTDQSERTVSASTSFTVAKSLFSLHISSPKRILEVGELADIKLSFKSPLKRKSEINLTLYKLIWKGKKMKKERAGEWRTEMGNREKKSIQISVEREGEYELIAKIGDEILDRIPLTVLPSLEEGVYSLPQPLKYPRLFTDKSSYNPGDEALVVIDMPSQHTALLTYEGRELFKYEVRELKRGRHLLRLPNLGSKGYRLRLRLSFIRKGKLVEEGTAIFVNRPIPKLKVSLETDKKVYQPREEVLCKLKLKDDKGIPLRGEISAAVVDEAIFKLMDEDADADIRSFFSFKESVDVITRWSNYDIYLGPVSKAFTEKEVRRRFLDTAFWLPSLITDDKGEASFSFQLPDNITSWRITVVGNTEKSIFGAGKLNIIARKPIFLRLGMPPFLRYGDETTIAGILRNQTNEVQEAGIELKAKGLEILSPKEGKLRVSPQKEGKEEWRVKVGEEIAATLTIYAIATSGLRDAMELNLPIFPFGFPTEYTKSGQVESETMEVVNIDKEAIPSSVLLKIYLSPSITSSLYSALHYLAQYPYGCTEQTVSTFLPDIAIYRFLKGTGIRDEKLEKSLPDMIIKGIFRLYSLAEPDGGWGWMPGEGIDPWATAYALWGLWEAKKEGYPVNRWTMDGGKQKLLQLIKENLKKDIVPKLAYWEKEKWLFALYILSQMGENVAVQLDYFLPYIQKLSHKSKALLSLSYYYLEDLKKAGAVFKSLWEKREESEEICYWKDRWETVEPTAYALRALLKLQPRNPAAIKIARYILQEKRGEGWFSTKDTAQVILSLLDFARIWEHTKPNFSLTVKINGRKREEIAFSPRDVFAPPREISLSIKDLKLGKNEIGFLKRGQGKMFYSIKMVQVLRREEIKPVKGLAEVGIKRVYRPLTVSTKQGLEWKAGSPSEIFKKGKLIEVEVSLNIPKKDFPSHYFVLEEPLPPGCELIEVDTGEGGGWYYDELEDRLAFYIPYLSSGKSKLKYRLRANIVGDYRVMPTVLYNMYFPQYKSLGNSNRVMIR